MQKFCIGDFVSVNKWFYGRVDQYASDGDLYIINSIDFLIKVRPEDCRFIR